MSSEWDDDELEDEAWTDEDELDEDDDSYTAACPECGIEIYADADVCHACGHFIIHESSAWQGRSTWWVVLGVLGIIAVIFAIAF